MAGPGPRSLSFGPSFQPSSRRSAVQPAMQLADPVADFGVGIPSHPARCCRAKTGREKIALEGTQTELETGLRCEISSLDVPTGAMLPVWIRL